ncbi:hypothetical protein FRC11_007149 [Ceratobasidium sp. 423]|nr:hypothetical protein FRC11_007149 [Ceratobasidium sp. 423]
MSFQDSPGSLPDVTITVLDIVLRLCTIPRSRLPETTHYVVKQFLRQRPTFLNITLNTSELSIFAEQTTLEDFRPLVRRGRLGARSGAPVEISQEAWSVLQIDEDKFGDAGTRVCEISAALARAGISILYQSSYMSDFILVKSSSLPSVIALLAHAGFGLYSTDAVALTSTVSPPIIDPPVAMEERRLSVRGSLVLDGDMGPQDETDLESETPAELDNHCSPYDDEEQHADRSASPASPTASHSPAASNSSHAEATSSTVRSRSTCLRSSRRSAPPPQPFFSFTRAKGECASVVADVRLLASLFPPADRHMVLSAHELEGVDEIAMTSGEVKAAMRCLTIDLPHGLDTHGLVNHFSSTLHNNGINHLYSSTYKTANLLVDRQDAERAEALLQSC